MKIIALLFMACVLLILLTDNSLENVYSKHSSIPSILGNLAPYQGFQSFEVSLDFQAVYLPHTQAAVKRILGAKSYRSQSGVGYNNLPSHMGKPSFER